MSWPSHRHSSPPRVPSRVHVGVVALAILIASSAARTARAEGQPTPAEQHVSHGGYIGPDGKLTSLAGSAVLLAGAQAGWIIDHAFVLGGAGYVLTTEASSPAGLQRLDRPRATLSMTYAGARIAFVPMALHKVHAVLGLLAGGGRISSSGNGLSTLADGFFVIEPDAAFEAILAPPVRIALGASYRFTGGTGIPGLDAGALDGPAAFITLKLGEF